MKEVENMVDMIVVKKKLMYSKDGFSIIACTLIDYDKSLTKPIEHETFHTVTIKGKLPDLEDKVKYRVKGVSQYDSKYKSYSYNINVCHEYIDMTKKENQLKFFCRILSDNQVKNLFNTFDNVIDVLDKNDPNLLTTVKGIGIKSAKNILKKYNLTKDNSDVYVLFDGSGLSNKLIDKLINHYDGTSEVINIIKNTPYKLTGVHGIGFKTADMIALNNGYDKYGYERCVAYLKFFLYEQSQIGNSYEDISIIVDNIYKNLGDDYPIESIKLALKHCMDRNIMWHSQDKKQIGLMSIYNLEYSVANHLMRLKNAIPTKDINYNDWESKVHELEQSQGWNYTDEQMSAIKCAIENNVTLITGLPGTGKTTVVKAIISAINGDLRLAQCALSGRAGVNLTNSTSYKSSTIHKLLGYDGKEFLYNDKHKIEQNVIVLDELSMVDATILNHLLQSITSGSKLIMLGDDGQLESVGVGNIIHDLISTKVIAHCHLTKIHRQASKSALITESRKIRESVQIVKRDFEGEITLGELQDLTLIGYHDNPYREKGEIKPTLTKMFSKFVEKLELANNDIMKVCCLLPTKSTGSSCYRFNIAAQKYLIDVKNTKSIVANSSKDYGYSIYIGDKVMCNSNFNDGTREVEVLNDEGELITKQINIPIYNGNLGIVKDITDDYVSIEFDLIGLVNISSDNLKIIELGYCVTVHKKQGDSDDYIICGLDNSHYVMQNKELVYTMWTRAKKYCDFIFETPAFIRAVKTTNIKSKKTFLPLFLGGELNVS